MLSYILIDLQLKIVLIFTYIFQHSFVLLKILAKFVV